MMVLEELVRSVGVNEGGLRRAYTVRNSLKGTVKVMVAGV